MRGLRLVPGEREMGRTRVGRFVFGVTYRKEKGGGWSGRSVNYSFSHVFCLVSGKIVVVVSLRASVGACVGCW